LKRKQGRMGTWKRLREEGERRDIVIILSKNKKNILSGMFSSCFFLVFPISVESEYF